MEKVIRSICYFSDKNHEKAQLRLQEIASTLESEEYLIQTKRLCANSNNIKKLTKSVDDQSLFLSVGELDFNDAVKQIDDFYTAKNLSFNLNLSNKQIDMRDVSLLLDIINNKPEKTFNFTYVFNNANSSPYYPSANYEEEGFSVGLQPTNLSKHCRSLEEWFLKMKETWAEIYSLLKNEGDFLGIDSSVAPLFEGESSIVYFFRKLGLSFEESALTNTYLSITEYIKKNNPKPVGLCGVMLPCLEDFGLAEEYEKGNFSIERNIYLSLHSGLGIDTYPIGIDENPEKILNILNLIQSLSSKYMKPLSVRLVSDGQTSVGGKTNFQNEYLKDVVIRGL